MRAPFAMLIVAALCGSSAACANAELEQRVKELEDKNASMEKELKTVEQQKRDLQQKLAQAQKAPPAVKPNLDEVGKALGVKPGEKLFATFETSMGTMVAELFWEKVPVTITNFVQLAEGTKEWTNPKGEKTKAPLYNGTIFHRTS